MKFTVLLFLVTYTSAKPLISTLADYYAFVHPNPDTSFQDPEYGEYFEGDIEVPDNEDVPEMGPLNAITDLSLRWPNGVLRYELEESYSENATEAILRGINDLVQSTMVGNNNCLTILPRLEHINYVSVQDYSGCSSYVGMRGGSQRMSLTSGCWNRHGTIMHEFLHAYGFHHEQKRWDRQDHITINWDNIQPGTENNFFMMNSDDLDLLNTAYDYGSVMHYGAYGFAVDPSIPTIITLDPDVEIGQRIQLSALDIERVQIFYGCIPANESVHFKHIADKLAHFYKK